MLPPPHPKIVLPLLRHADEVFVTRKLPVVESFHSVGHRRQKLDKAATVELPSWLCAERKMGATDEGAETIKRKAGNIVKEMPPVIALLEEILLDI